MALVRGGSKADRSALTLNQKQKAHDEHKSRRSRKWELIPPHSSDSSAASLMQNTSKVVCDIPVLPASISMERETD